MKCDIMSGHRGDWDVSLCTWTGSQCVCVPALSMCKCTRDKPEKEKSVTFTLSPFVQIHSFIDLSLNINSAAHLDSCGIYFNYRDYTPNSNHNPKPNF